jgi:AraC family ethanolamine operon transcriptional activator
MVYGPGAEHFGINPVGLNFAFAVVEIGVIEELAADLGRHFRAPPRGSISALAPEPQASALRDALPRFIRASAAGTTPQANLEDDLLYSVTAALSDDGRSRPVKRTTKIDRRQIVRTSIDYAEATGHVPSISELCRAVHVSERLLRIAFAEVCGIPPTAFFRLWALNETKRRLLTAERHHGAVSEVATDVGIRHLGRFANRYRHLFGEYPSETQRSHG